jgi:hypothetical protein
LEFFEAAEAYENAFHELPAIFGLGISDEKLIELIKLALERGYPLTDKELVEGAGIEEAPPDAIL